jgi:hypothetical protein
VLRALGGVARIEGNYTEARARYEEAIALERQIGDKMTMAYLLMDLAMVLLTQSDHAPA